MRNKLRLTSRSLTALVAGAALLVACSSSKKTSTGTSTTTSLSSASTLVPTPTSAVTTPGASSTVVRSPVAKGFSPDSVTFVSLQEGWVLGATCATCPLAIAHTTDSGRSWSAIPAPPMTQNLETQLPPRIRFATPRDGWVFGDLGLWSTHDGGAHWTKPAQAAGLQAGANDLEASAGTVYAVSFNNQSMFEIQSSPVSHDDWRSTGTSFETGAGPVPTIQIVLHGSLGWIVENDRDVITGERLQGGHWSTWTPPCTKAQGLAFLSASASSTLNLVAYCPTSNFATSPPGSVGLYTSSNGNTFGSPVTLPAALTKSTGPLTSAGPSQATLAAQTSDLKYQLDSTFDGGHTWTAVTPDLPSPFVDLGFTSATQGVAVETPGNANSGALFMTFDGGHTWRQGYF